MLSRPNGREAFAVFQTQLAALDKDENLELDFEGVVTFSPSWADEFLSPLLDILGDRLVLLPSDNLSVHATIRILQEASKRSFKMKS